MLLDRAIAIARGRGHRRVTRAHVLAALFAETGLVHAECWATTDVRAMIEHLLDLESADSVSTYRDAPPPTVDPALERKLKKLKPFFGDPRSIDVFEALIEDIDLSPFAWDATPIRRFYDAVLVEARGSNVVVVDHALIVLTKDERFAEALRKVGADLEEVAESLRVRVANGFRSGALSSFASMKARAAIHANATKRHALDLELLVVSFLNVAESKVALEVAGVDRNELLFFYLHPDAVTVTAEAGPATVVFHDDDITTQATVVDVLERYFDKTPYEARRLMLRVHEKGSAAFAVPSGTAAAEAIRAIRREVPTLWIEVRM